MKCPTCGTESGHSGESTTLVGGGSFTDASGISHNHDDNCLKRRYTCPSCAHQWTEGVRRRCDTMYCEWRGKVSCPCHGDKVDQWTDPPFDTGASIWG